MQNVVLQNTVADFDPLQVVDVVQTGLAPEDWVVATAQRRLLVFQIVRNGLFALGSGVASLFFLTLWLFSITHIEGNPDVIYSIAVLFVAFVGSGLFLVACAFEMWKALRMLIAAQAPWIAVTPNGVVEYLGPTMGIRYASAYANVISIVPLRQQPPRARWLNPYLSGSWVELLAASSNTSKQASCATMDDQSGVSASGATGSTCHRFPARLPFAYDGALTMEFFFFHGAC